MRYYERLGLLPEPIRSPGGYRAYPTETVRRVLFIKQAQGLGLVATCERPRAERECPVMHRMVGALGPDDSVVGR